MNDRKSTSRAEPPSIQCRQSKVSVRARPLAPETTIMSKLPLLCLPVPPGQAFQRRYTTIRMRPLRQILSESALGGLFLRRQRELAVLQCVREALPPALAAQVSIVDARLAELALVAGSGAAAGLIRQRIPVLLERLRCAGLEFTGIQVGVQVRPSGTAPLKHVAKQLDSESAATLRRRADELADVELAAALRRLADHAGDPRSGTAAQTLHGVEDQHPE